MARRLPLQPQGRQTSWTLANLRRRLGVVVRLERRAPQLLQHAGQQHPPLDGALGRENGPRPRQR
eukprot:11944327-Alexandrium_andersonii.AAC.1